MPETSAGDASHTPHPPSAPSPLCGGEKGLADDDLLFNSPAGVPTRPFAPACGGEGARRADEGASRRVGERQLCCRSPESSALRLSALRSDLLQNLLEQFLLGRNHGDRVG